MLFCVPSVKRKRNFSPGFSCFFTSSFSRRPAAPDSTVLPLSLTVSASCPGPVFRHRREEAGPSSGGGVGETDPEAGGEPPVNTPALLKPDSAVNQRPGIWIKNLAWGGTTDQKIKKGVKLLSICLFITAVTSLSCLEFTLLPKKKEDTEECLWKVLNSHHLGRKKKNTSDSSWRTRTALIHPLKVPFNSITPDPISNPLSLQILKHRRLFNHH